MRYTLMLFLLTACGDDAPVDLAPDAAPDASPSVADTCEISMTPPAPDTRLGGTGCWTAITVTLACEGQAFDRVAVAWAKLQLVEPYTQGGIVETVYRCNEPVVATFQVPCDPPVAGGAGFQHPQLGGDVLNESGPRILCETAVEAPP